MPLGVKNGTARLEEHNSAWTGMAAELIQELRSVLGQDAKDIQHVGSTSIPGIPAKPIIDIAVGVENVEIAEKHRAVLEAHGLHYMGEIVAEQRMYCKSTPGCDDRTHHIHFVVYGSKRWNDYLNMRDYCNAFPKVAAAYGELKRGLAAKYANDRTMYRDSKDAFIKATLRDAEAWRASLGDKNE